MYFNIQAFSWLGRIALFLLFLFYLLFLLFILFYFNFFLPAVLRTPPPLTERLEEAIISSIAYEQAPG